MARIASYATGTVSEIKRYDAHRGDRVIPYNYVPKDTEKEKWEVVNVEVNKYSDDTITYNWDDTPFKKFLRTSEFMAFALFKDALKEDPDSSNRWSQDDLKKIEEFEKKTESRVVREFEEEMKAREKYRETMDKWDPEWDEPWSEEY